MRKLFVVFILALAFGIAIGWALRESQAVQDCVGAEGKWLPKAGHCSGSPLGEAES